MTATLTWLDLTSRDRDKMRQVLDLFEEKGTVDEMGLGSLRDVLADDLFPGTSTIQTRLRYFLFVPWVYQRLERERVSSDRVEREARAAELALIEPLSQQEDNEGIIGARARRSLTRLPSSVYWAGLVHWGIFQHQQSQSWYHANLVRLSRSSEELARADDPGVTWMRRPAWHPRLPQPPKGFPEVAAFALTAPEASFLLGRIEERCAGSLLAWLAREGSGQPAATFWNDAVALQAPEAVRGVIELARRFSLHVEGAPLLYNLMLAERRNAESDAPRVDHYRSGLAAWAAEESRESPFDPVALWTFASVRQARLPRPQQRFVESWTRRLSEVGPARVADDVELRTLIERREFELKGGRARLRNEARRNAWSGRVGVGRMDFRWFRVRQLLTDLRSALGS